MSTFLNPQPSIFNSLLEENYYSPKLEIPFFHRHFPNMVFYSKMAHIVWRASRLSKKGGYTPSSWIKDSFDTFRALESVGVVFKLENLLSFAQLHSSCVFVANHMSTLETFVLPCLIRPRINFTFVVKQQLLENIFMKDVLFAVNSIAVSRVNPREDLKEVLTKGVEMLQNNISILIFPQTTRSDNFIPNEFNSIGIKLAKRAGVPVVPIALKTDAWGNGKKLKDFGKIDPTKTVHFCFGKPLEITGNGKDEHEAIIDFITTKLDLWCK